MKMKQYLPMVCFNVAGWAWKHSKEKYEDRLKRALEHVRTSRLTKVKGAKKELPFIIGLSEVALAKGKYIDTIRSEMPEYELIFPVGYNPEISPKSVINILLVRKDQLIEYEVLELNMLKKEEDKLLLYNYVTLSTTVGNFRIINMHGVHTANEDKPEWYRATREVLSKKIMRAVVEEIAMYYDDERLVLMGDMNRTPSDKYLTKIMYGYNMIPVIDRKANTYFGKKSKKHLDYVLVSCATIANKNNTVFVGEVDDSTFYNSKPISDHALLIGCMAVDCEVSA